MLPLLPVEGWESTGQLLALLTTAVSACVSLLLSLRG